MTRVYRYFIDSCLSVVFFVVVVVVLIIVVVALENHPGIAFINVAFIVVVVIEICRLVVIVEYRIVIIAVVFARWNLSWFFVGPSLASLGEAICPPERSRGAVIGLVDSMSVQVTSLCCLVLSGPTLPSNPLPEWKD